MKTTDQLFSQLEALGAAECGHRNGSLALHLRGTERMLREWGAGEPLCRAGLYHAVYGTDGYLNTLASLANRKSIAELIGSEAEELAYMYGACNRMVFYPRIGTESQLMFADRFSNSEYEIRPEQLAHLCELILANELELASNDGEFRVKHGMALSQLYERMAGLVTPATYHAYRRILG